MTATARDYRPEIDALRAIAVVAVVAFHLFPALVPGGFVGVDVFFVISGYLIIRNLLTGLAAGAFTFAGFYLGRVRRLYPSYLTVIAATSAAGWFVLTPDQLERFAASLIASVAYASNFVFVAESGYFDLGADQKPLLHTWSLSVEEQFYLVFPLAIALFRRRGWRPGTLLTALVVLSFAANVLLVGRAPSAVFFLSPFRMWEFALGGLLAAGAYPGARRGPLHPVLVVAGLGAIGASIFTFSGDVPYPGWAALVPVLGSVLVIGSARFLAGHPLIRVLSFRPLVVVGLLSYALYLWHWPLLVLFRVVAEKSQPSALEGALLAGATLGLAAISTFWIEPPFRRGVVSARATLGLAVAGSTLFAAVGLHGLVTEGAVYRFPLARVYAETRRGEVRERRLAESDQSDCGRFLQADGLEPAVLDEICVAYGSGDHVDYVLWGDSHVRNLGMALARQTDDTFLVVRTLGCPPFVGVRRSDATESAATCSVEVQNAVLAALERLRPDSVALVARWSLYHHGWRENGVVKNNTHFLCDDGTCGRASPATSLATMTRAFERTAKAVSAFSRLVVVEAVPTLRKTGDALVLLPPGKREAFVPTQAEHEATERALHALFETRREALGFQTFDPAADLCAAGRCRFQDERRLCYLDDNHLTIACWKRIASPLLPLLRGSTGWTGGASEQ